MYYQLFFSTKKFLSFGYATRKMRVLQLILLEYVLNVWYYLKFRLKMQSFWLFTPISQALPSVANYEVSRAARLCASQG